MERYKKYPYPKYTHFTQFKKITSFFCSLEKKKVRNFTVNYCSNLLNLKSYILYILQNSYSKIHTKKDKSKDKIKYENVFTHSNKTGTYHISQNYLLPLQDRYLIVIHNEQAC